MIRFDGSLPSMWPTVILWRPSVSNPNFVASSAASLMIRWPQ